MSQNAVGHIYRSFRYRLDPTPEQEEQFRRFAGVCRLVYNLALEQRNTWGRRYLSAEGRRISFPSQSAELTALRKEFDWIEAVNRGCVNQALRDLDGAFNAFFSGRARYPNFRSKDSGRRFRFEGRDVATRSLNSKFSAVKMPKIGLVRFRQSRPIEGAIKSATITEDALGWHVSFACQIEHETPAPRAEAVGIDRGVTTTLALSTGEMLTMPASLERIEVKKRRAQRIVARRKRGSNRRRRAQARVARLQAKQARIRRNFHHKAALSIAKRFGIVVLEDLNTRGMTASARGTVAEPGRNVRQKSGLNRVILNASWHQFATILTYKTEERGGHVVTVPPRFTSPTCAACGVVDAESRESQARFVCTSCGHADHADVNAAINIKRRWSTSLLDVEGCGHGPVEASTGRGDIISENLCLPGREDANKAAPLPEIQPKNKGGVRAP